MPDYRGMYDRDYVGVWDLDGRDKVVVISSVACAALVSEGNKKTKKPVLSFRGFDKKLAVNKTNGKILAKLFGTTETEKWVGKPITIYPTTTKFGSDIVDCVRIRPSHPQQQGRPQQQRQQTSADEPPEPGSFDQ
jgi:hypothetical protein